MSLLSKVSYCKIHLVSARIELRSILNVLGLCSDERAEKRIKKMFLK